MQQHIFLTGAGKGFLITNERRKAFERHKDNSFPIPLADFVEKLEKELRANELGGLLKEAARERCVTEQVAELDIAEEDRLRAQWYGLLARFLSAPPDAATLALARGLVGDDSELGKGVKALAAAAKGTAVEAVDEEFFDLFVGVGQGELLPYASYYLTGFLNEKPLAALRQDMDELRIARVEDVKEPEDHVASLCEMMAGMITGAFGAPVALDKQRWFFDKHIGCWAPRFFEDLQAARSAAFYMPVGMIGSVFMAVESQAFEMAA